MNKEETDIQTFWSHCVKSGIVCKALSIKKNPQNCFSLPSLRGKSRAVGPISVSVEEPVGYGAPLISVPYLSVLNVQNIRGGLVPRCVPPFSLFSRLLSRRYREVHPYSAQGLWIAACLASYRHQMKRMGIEKVQTKAEPPYSSSVVAMPKPLWYSTMAPWCSDTFFYYLPSPFSSRGWHYYPGVQHQLMNEKENIPLLLPGLHHRTQKYINLTFALLCCYGHKKKVPMSEIPDRYHLSLAYYTVLYRSTLIPINGEPSAPGDLNELIDAAPHLPLLTSLVPLIEHLRPIVVYNNDVGIEKTSDGSKVDGREIETLTPNCTLYTCQQSEFISPTSRRRATTAPTSSLFSPRKVVVCAGRDLKKGEELTLGF